MLTQPPTKKKNKAIIFGVLALFLIVGGLLASTLLTSKSQDVRNQASVAQGLVNISVMSTSIDAENAVGIPIKIDINVDTGGANIDAIQLTGNFRGVDVKDVIFVKSPEATEIGLKSIKKELSKDGIMLAFTLKDPNTPVKGNFKLGTIKLTPKKNGKLQFTLDKTESKATIYKTGEDTLNTPQITTINIGGDGFVKSPIVEKPIIIDKGAACIVDADCGDGYICYQPPMPKCLEGQPCKLIQVMPAKYCAQSDLKPSVKPTPSPTPPPTETPGGGFVTGPGTTTPPGEVPQRCRINSDCDTNQTCFQPTMPVCEDGQACAMVMPTKYCIDNEVTPTVRPTVAPTVKPSPSPSPDDGFVRNPGNETPVRTTSCRTSSDCKEGTFCYQPPMPKCFEGQPCKLIQVMPAKYCKEEPVLFDDPKPTRTPTTISERICEYKYSAWTKCNDGVQSREIITDINCDGFVISKPKTIKSCQVAQCQSNKDCSTNQICSRDGMCKPSPIKIDFNKDGKVNLKDYSIMVRSLFTKAKRTDINQDGITDIVDYSLFLKYFATPEAIIN